MGRAELAALKQSRSDSAASLMRFCESAIDPTQFELFVGALFAALGYTGEHNGKTHDGGIDLLVRHCRRGKGVVQVKQYRSSKVTEPQIRDLYGALCAKQEVEYGVMVVLSDCTKEARTWPEREGVDNLEIWTHRELTALLELHAVAVLVEFVKLLEHRHEADARQLAHGILVTPKHTRQHHAKPFSQRNSHASNNLPPNTHRSSSTSIPASPAAKSSAAKRRDPPSSTLSSAKKRTGKGKGKAKGAQLKSLRQNWSQCKFSGSGQTQTQAQQEEGLEKDKLVSPLLDKRDVVNTPNVTASARSRLKPRLSPVSTDNSSSLLIDESQSDDENHGAEYGHRSRSPYAQQEASEGGINTDMMWSMTNLNKKRRKRRPWLQSDDQLVMGGIAQFGQGWQETLDQWDRIFEQSHSRFSQPWTLNDVRKHYACVLKPKLMTGSNQLQ